ncbi:P-loop containing nucleoside triphosphate hydrolase protein [Hygrophoropsis aurantiaca]|uniref:P-loop containing nucleoside triphosphate hydrolase protein n=1 Tax=Hygrophoropsis aurantiaca TaxID=72124 RepID=A0ACB8AIU2_9AGAM|nr:P-loop containing nucleoside triphosphate hydrolase protein [Hygrophoropsis aurantiaca]
MPTPPMPPSSNYIPNIIIFGETGCGKSSLINLIAANTVAKTSSGAAGCTLDAKDYLVPINEQKFRLWDTVGLNEPHMSANDYLQAIGKAYDLIRRLQCTGGVALLMFCMRGGRITAAAESNFHLFYDILCKKEVPVALVLTHLENEDRMEDWWTNNNALFAKARMHSAGHACITATPG